MEAGIHQLTAGYALDALDPEQRREYEAHLSTCAHCQDELASFWETTEALAVAASGPEPSPELRERILAEVRTEPPQVVVPFEPRRRRAVPVLAAAAAIAAVVALGVGVWASDLSSQLDETRAALDRARGCPGPRRSRCTIGLAAGGRGPAGGESAGRRCSFCTASTAPAGKTYEMWIVPGGDITSANRAGLFSGRVGSEIERLDGTVGVGDVVAVTIETAGGVDAPTTAPIIASDPV